MKGKKMGILLIITGILVTFSIIGGVFFVFFKGIGGSKVENNTAIIQGKAISQKRIILSEKFVNCYYDEEYLYVEQVGAKAKFPLKNITEINATE